MFSNWEILNPSPAAEEMEKVNPDPVVRDKEEKPYTVRYDAVNVSAQLEASKPAPQVVNNP